MKHFVCARTIKMMSSSSIKSMHTSLFRIVKWLGTKEVSAIRPIYLIGKLLPNEAEYKQNKRARA